MAALFPVFAILVLIFTFYTIGLNGVIMAMIVGAIGFALGSIANNGWAIFGAILGVLIVIASHNKENLKFAAPLIPMMISGAVGFLIGSFLSPGWAIFGVALGALIGIQIFREMKKQSK